MPVALCGHRYLDGRLCVAGAKHGERCAQHRTSAPPETCLSCGKRIQFGRALCGRCSVPQCTARLADGSQCPARTHSRQGLCPDHRERIRNTCRAEGCDRVTRAKGGLCRDHAPVPRGRPPKPRVGPVVAPGLTDDDVDAILCDVLGETHGAAPESFGEHAAAPESFGEHAAENAAENAN